MVIVTFQRRTAHPPDAGAQRCLRGIGFAKYVLVNTRPEFDRYRHSTASLSHNILQQGRKLYG